MSTFLSISVRHAITIVLLGIIFIQNSEAIKDKKNELMSMALGALMGHRHPQYHHHPQPFVPVPVPVPVHQPQKEIIIKHVPVLIPVYHHVPDHDFQDWQDWGGHWRRR